MKKLSTAVGPRLNSAFFERPDGPICPVSARLERICSDFLLPGEGVWWKYVAQGVEFLDGEDEEMNTRKEPKLMHYRRGQSWPDVELYLAQSAFAQE